MELVLQLTSQRCSTETPTLVLYSILSRCLTWNIVNARAFHMDMLSRYFATSFDSVKVSWILCWLANDSKKYGDKRNVCIKTIVDEQLWGNYEFCYIFASPIIHYTWYDLWMRLNAQNKASYTHIKFDRWRTRKFWSRFKFRIVWYQLE